MVDLVIRGATIVDGTGAPSFTGDVAVDRGRIVEVGRVDSPSTREIDADGLLLTPGFVDLHTHFDGQATWDQVLAPSSWHGVTTVAMGNCGVGFAPARPDHHDFLIRLLEGVEDIPGTALAEGLSWEWETFPEYLDVLEALPHTIDLGAHVPHAALRAYVMGGRGADPEEAATLAEITRMSALVGEAVRAGAIGVATSRTVNHRTSDGNLLGTLRADATEMLALAAAVGSAGHGVIQLITDAFQTEDDAFFDDEFDLIEAMAVVSGRPLSLSVIQSPRVPDRWHDLMARIDEMAARGLPVRGQVASRPIGSLLGLEATANPFVPCPSYVAIADLAVPERVAAMREPERRRRILEEFAAFVHADRGDGPRDYYQRLADNFDLLFKLDDPVDYQIDAADAFGAIAARTGADAAEMIYDALLEMDGRRLIYYPGSNFARRDFRDLAQMVEHPNALFGLSDAGAHCGIISDASMPTSCLTMWGRDRRDGPPMPVEYLVHGLTQRNAVHMGWLDRGTVAPGQVADLNLIDFENLGCAHPVIVHDLPAGGHRLVQRAYGYRATIKSGVVTFEDGEHTGAFPGRLLRGATDGR